MPQMNTATLDLTAAELTALIDALPVTPANAVLSAKLNDAYWQITRPPYDPREGKTIYEERNGIWRGYSIDECRDERTGLRNGNLRIVLWEGDEESATIYNIFEIEASWVEKRLRPKAPVRISWIPEVAVGFDNSVVRAALARHNEMRVA